MANKFLPFHAKASAVDSSSGSPKQKKHALDTVFLSNSLEKIGSTYQFAAEYGVAARPFCESLALGVPVFADRKECDTKTKIICVQFIVSVSKLKVRQIFRTCVN